jgi:hypothetical protein
MSYETKKNNMKTIFNKYLFGTVALLALMVLGGCDKDTEGMTRITYYADLTLEGESTIYVDKGTTFVDPGFTATMNGEDVSDQVEVSSNVNTAKSGVYSISYIIYNEDGFSSSASRTVIVLDPNDPIEGFWDTDPDSFREYNGSQVAYKGSYEILLINQGDGSYSVDDLMGGWYCQRAGYGSSYAMQGVVDIADDGTIEMEYGYVPGWGDYATAMYNGHYDATTGTIFWQVEYTYYPFIFNVTMYKR